MIKIHVDAKVRENLLKSVSSSGDKMWLNSEKCRGSCIEWYPQMKKKSSKLNRVSTQLRNTVFIANYRVYVHQKKVIVLADIFAGAQVGELPNHCRHWCECIEPKV